MWYIYHVNKIILPIWRLFCQTNEFTGNILYTNITYLVKASADQCKSSTVRRQMGDEAVDHEMDLATQVLLKCVFIYFFFPNLSYYAQDYLSTITRFAHKCTLYLNFVQQIFYRLYL